MLYETADEADHSTLHLFFLLPLDIVREYLHARLGQLGDDLADSVVVVTPEVSQRAGPPAFADRVRHLRLSLILAAHTDGLGPAQEARRHL